MKKLLPTHYFLLTFTLPKQFRSVVRSHQKIAYTALFSSIQETLKKLAKDKRFVGSSRVGFLADAEVQDKATETINFKIQIRLPVAATGYVCSNSVQWRVLTVSTGFSERMDDPVFV